MIQCFYLLAEQLISYSAFVPLKGRTFSGLIQSFLASCEQLNNVFLPIYETAEGRKVYDETLKSVRENFPQYIREIEGTADGAKVPFHKVRVYTKYLLCSHFEEVRK